LTLRSLWQLAALKVQQMQGVSGKPLTRLPPL
jgi:hypothetical protein